MKSNKTILALLVLSVLVFSVLSAGCIGEKPSTATSVSSKTLSTQSKVQTTTPSKTEKETARKITMTDFRGKTIELSKPAEKTVILAAYWPEIVVALGKKDAIVGIDKATPYNLYVPEEIRKKPVVGCWDSVNVEELASLKPDVVIAGYYGLSNSVIEQIEGLGIPVLDLTPESFEDEIRAIEIMGKAFGAEDKAREIVDFMKNRRKKIINLAKTIPDKKRLKAVFICGKYLLKGEILVYVNETYAKSMREAGAIDIGPQMSGEATKFRFGVKVDFEELVKHDPDVILLTTSSSLKTIRQIANAIISDPKWHVLKAYKTGRVYLVPYGYVRPQEKEVTAAVFGWGIRSVIGREYVAKALYPDVYKDIDWIADLEYMFKLYGVEMPKQAYAMFRITPKGLIKEYVDESGKVVTVAVSLED
ncbi:MAG: hypothetical protein DRO89_05280 [Candidatus Altiarchaeales archaeon]|nr:MAG: hypothetical protein DRO89_05280 [Candidatus Altiarchaeales archaeon]